MGDHASTQQQDLCWPVDLEPGPCCCDSVNRCATKHRGAENMKAKCNQSSRFTQEDLDITGFVTLRSLLFKFIYSFNFPSGCCGYVSVGGALCSGSYTCGSGGKILIDHREGRQAARDRLAREKEAGSRRINSEGRDMQSHTQLVSVSCIFI